MQLKLQDPKCRMCKSPKLYRYLDLGHTPPADQFLTKEQLSQPETTYPLRVAVCEACGLMQLDHVVAPEILYQNDYPYESSTTKTGRAHWASFASEVTQQIELPKDSLVVDIGSNVGVLLRAFADQGMRVIGVDPAPNIVEIALKSGTETICDFFGETAAREVLKRKGPASLITATNVFAHVDDLDALVKAVGTLLSERGVFVFEAPYFPELLKSLEYDTIYHEHLSYLSVKPLLGFFEKHGMRVFDVRRVDIHGGSIRVFVGKGKERTVSERVKRLVGYEEELQIYSRDVLDRFAQEVANHRLELANLLRSLKQSGKRIVAVSAPAKGMTLLNYCRIGPELLDYVTEKSQLKIGRYTPGTHIPVVSDEELLRNPPDYALVLAWNFASEIMANLSAYRKAGGKFIVPIPRPTVVE